MNLGRSVELKQAFHKRIVDDLGAQFKVLSQDVGHQLGGGRKGNWSFGGGIAQYVT